MTNSCITNLVVSPCDWATQTHFYLGGFNDGFWAALSLAAVIAVYRAVNSSYRFPND